MTTRQASVEETTPYLIKKSRERFQHNAIAWALVGMPETRTMLGARTSLTAPEAHHGHVVDGEPGGALG